MICLSCTGRTIEENLGLIEKNRKFIDMAELRADFLPAEELQRLAAFPASAGIPCILTYRKPADGGNPLGVCSDSAADGGGSIQKRCEILSEALKGDWAYIDLEDDAGAECEQALKKTAEQKGIRIIISFHDFHSVPDDLAERMLENSCGDRYIPKAAVMPHNTADLIKLFDVYNRLEQVKSLSAGYSCTSGPLLSDYILVGMGAAGFPSRILAGAYGSMLTFCSASENKAAPGHISPEEISAGYNYREISKDTRLFGIIGNPVMHTKSPAIHNAALQRHGIDAVYIPFETAEPELLLSEAGRFGLDGLSVTIPHKQRIISAASEVEPAVEKIGACNTLVRRGDEWFGYNTDWPGFLSPLDSAVMGGGAVPGGEGFRGGRALVAGAGGAARAVVYALVSRNFEVVIVNRTAARAEALAAEFGCRGYGYEAAEAEGVFGQPYRIVVQTTSVGMEPDDGRSPLPGFDFSNVEIAYDLIYAPPKTIFLREAEKAGCTIINGLPMLKAQAAEQFRLFTGREIQ